jgi:hypothetical protein
LISGSTNRINTVRLHLVEPVAYGIGVPVEANVMIRRIMQAASAAFGSCVGILAVNLFLDPTLLGFAAFCGALGLAFLTIAASGLVSLLR